MSMAIERAVESLVRDYSQFKARTQRRLDIMSTWQATTGAGGGGETDHPRLHNINSSLDHIFPLEWANLSKTGSNLNEIQTRNYIDLQNRTHNIVGADHSLAAAKYSLVGATADNVLGVLLARGNAQAPGNFDTILRADGTGSLALVNLFLDGYLETPEIQSPLHLFLNPQNGGKIHVTGSLTHPSWVSREFGIGMDFTTGSIDAQSIQAQRAHFRSAIIDVTKAYAGDLSITKSVSTVADDSAFTVPAFGASDTLILDDLPGLDGIALADDDDWAKVYIYSREQYQSAHPFHVQTDVYSFNVTAPTLQENSFEGTSIGNMPAAWWESGGGNGTTEITPTRMSVQVDPADAGNQVFDKTGNVTNGHTHLRSSVGIQSETSGYVVTGRFYLINDGGIGFTVLSKYSDTGTSIDEYVRIRRTYGGDPFEVANHGSYPAPDAGYGTGTADGTTIPVVSTWYQFKVDVDVQGTYTYVKFKFWEDGDPEPSAWELDVRFSGANRPTQGTAGLWLFSGDYQVDDYRVAERVAFNNGTVSFGGEAIRQGDYLMYYIVATEAPANFISITDQPFDIDFVGAVIPSRMSHKRGFAATDGVFGCTYSLSSNTEQKGIIVAHHFRNVDPNAVSVTDLSSDTPPVSYNGSGYDEDKYGEAIVAIMLDEGGLISTEPTSDTEMSQMVREASTTGATFQSNLYYAQILTADGATQASGTIDYPGNTSNTYVQRFAFEGLGATGPLNIGRIWGTIVEDTVTVTPDGTQAWTWTTEEIDYPGGDIVEPGQTVLIYGQGVAGNPQLGDGYIELTTRDPASSGPYLRMAMMSPTPTTLPPYVFFQAGTIDSLGWTSATYGVVITKPSTFNINQTPTQYIEISDSKVLARGIPLQMYDSGGTWKVEIKDTGLMRLGTNLSSAGNANTGFYFDPTTGALQIGRSGYPGSVTVVGNITIKNPADVQTVLVQNGWGFLDQSPGPAGLYMTSTYMGFWNGSTWATYMNNSGQFSFGSTERIFFDGTKLYGRNVSGTTQWSINTSDGKIRAGVDTVALDREGISIEVDPTLGNTGYQNYNYLTWVEGIFGSYDPVYRGGVRRGGAGGWTHIYRQVVGGVSGSGAYEVVIADDVDGSFTTTNIHARWIVNEFFGKLIGVGLEVSGRSVTTDDLAPILPGTLRLRNSNGQFIDLYCDAAGDLWAGSTKLT